MQLRLLSLMFFLTIGSVLADPVTITWTGTPSVFGSSCPACGDSTASASFTSGETAILDAQGPSTYAEAVGVESSFNVIDEFTISAPAEINVAVTASYGVYAESCPAIGCSAGMTTYDLYGQFQGRLGLIDGADSLWIPLSASGDSDVPCVGGCTASLSLTDSESGEVFLNAGTYEVLASMTDSTNSGGDSMSGSELRAVFTDPSVPEPSYFGLSVFGILGCFCFRRFARRSSKV